VQLTARDCENANIFFSHWRFRNKVAFPFSGCEQFKYPEQNTSREEPNVDTTQESTEPPKKRGRGRPPGAKNKSSGEKEDKPRRGRGRPPGSKNKPSIPDSKEAPEQQPESSRGKPLDPEDTFFIKEMGSDVFEKLMDNDQAAVRKVYEWFAKIEEDRWEDVLWISEKQRAMVFQIFMGN
jgi:hypothetical protein